TYLSTFEVLGGLGLLLGTVGLGTVLLRNVHERRGELAVLRAVGYSRGALAWIVLGETAFLLTLGLAVGGGAALLPVLARPGGLERGPGWESLAVLFLGIFAAGMASSVLALCSALRAPLIPALRAE
ncbi:MAG TPA: ABC transporter permease, partial [Planctomycetota bacterium]|nr:ABC transporter permease [Planctomycetota bacterium]